jgi:hypothetical protein
VVVNKKPKKKRNVVHHTIKYQLWRCGIRHAQIFFQKQATAAKREVKRPKSRISIEMLKYEIYYVSKHHEQNKKKQRRPAGSAITAAKQGASMPYVDVDILSTHHIERHRTTDCESLKTEWGQEMQRLRLFQYL